MREQIGCFLFQFYIKPQLGHRGGIRTPVVSYFNSTSNHNAARAGNALAHVVSYFNSTSNHNPRICDLLIVIRLCGRMNGTNGA